MMGILNITQDVIFNNSITNYQFHNHSPYQPSTKNNDEIIISIQQQDVYVYLHDSSIIVEGVIIKADNTVSATAKLANNAPAFLFDSITYKLNNYEIDQCRNVGITTTMKNYISKNPNESKMLYKAGWSPDEPITPTSGRFYFCIPLNSILGFAEDYRKIMINAKHELILTRTRNDENALISPTDNVEFNILKVYWRVPHVTVSDEEKIPLLKIISSGTPIQMSFRSWDLCEYPTLPSNTNHHIWTIKTTNQLEKPRFVIFALQTDKKNKKDKDASKFDHCNLTDIKLHLNSESYPHGDLSNKYNQNKYAILYDMCTRFQSLYYDIPNQPLLSWEKFKEDAPIIVIDCSHQNETLKTGPVDVKIEFKTENNIPENTSAYCLLLHDRLVQYSPLTSEVIKV